MVIAKPWQHAGTKQVPLASCLPEREPTVSGETRPIHVAWLGPRTAGLEVLHNRMLETPQALVTTLDLPAGGPLASHRMQELQLLRSARLVVACSTRIDYPWQSIGQLQQAFPEVPLALATDMWWDGAGRTGLARLRHVTLPWHRWWDGWVDWLQGTTSAWFEPCPAAVVLSAGRPLAAGGLSGLIVADCGATGEAWRMAAESAGAEAMVLSSRAFRDRQPAATPQPQWILWDDSCLDTYARQDPVSQTSTWLQAARQRFPDASLCCGLTICRAEAWRQLALSGAAEWLSKPATGRGLARWLNSLSAAFLRRR